MVRVFLFLFVLLLLLQFAFPGEVTEALLLFIFLLGFGYIVLVLIFNIVLWKKRSQDDIKAERKVFGRGDHVRRYDSRKEYAEAVKLIRDNGEQEKE